MADPVLTSVVFCDLGDTLLWSNGPRLAFNFGFTDLGAGRYLEAWVPANLIFDQFELILTLRILNTMIAHTVITNGEVISVGTHHWQVKFPSRFTALSPLLELRASGTLVKATDAVTLPVSGANITIDTWKLVSNPTGLPTQVNNIKTYLAENENSTGPYMHENRFVSFFHVGGMEYEGGTTTGTTALRHETFHSWWARGIKPARQFKQGFEAFLVSGSKAQIPISVRPQEQLVFGLRLKVPQETKSGETLRLDMVQRDTKSKKILGGIAVQINVL